MRGNLEISLSSNAWYEKEEVAFKFVILFRLDLLDYSVIIKTYPL